MSLPESFYELERKHLDELERKVLVAIRLRRRVLAEDGRAKDVSALRASPAIARGAR